MPRPPTFDSPLRQVREAIGATQARLAGMIGCSAPTVQAIENGQRKITREMAERLMDVTGVLYFSLMAGSKEALDVNGGRYTSASFLDYQSLRVAGLKGSVKKELLLMVLGLIDAAEITGKAPLLFYYLSQSLTKIAQRLSLSDVVRDASEGVAPTGGKPITVSELRRLPDRGRSLGFIDSDHLSDDQEFTPKLVPVKRKPKQVIFLHFCDWDAVEQQFNAERMRNILEPLGTETNAGVGEEPRKQKIETLEPESHDDERFMTASMRRVLKAMGREEANIEKGGEQRTHEAEKRGAHPDKRPKGSASSAKSRRQPSRQDSHA